MNDVLEMAILLVAATIASRALAPRALLRRVSALSRACAASAEPASPEALVAHGARVVRALGARTPLANCLDEAIALRLWLARRGVVGDVVVGFRRRDNEWDGHAWLATPYRELLMGEGGHTIAFRESGL